MNNVIYILDYITKYEDLWSEVGSIKFADIAEDIAIKIFITALLTSTTNKSEYVKSELRKLEEAYNEKKLQDLYIKLEKSSYKHSYYGSLSDLLKKGEEIYYKSEQALKKFKIVSHNLNKKNFVELIEAEKKYFNKEKAIKVAMNKIYETLYLYHMAFFELKTYNCLLSLLEDITQNFDQRKIVGG